MKRFRAVNAAESSNWTRYALAGTALLGAPLAADAAVITSGPLDISISAAATPSNQSYLFDFDTDTNADFGLFAINGTGTRLVLSLSTGAIVGNSLFATPLGAGVVIGAGSEFTSKAYLLKDGVKSSGNPGVVGYWPNDLAQFRFLGFSFTDGASATHYGWMRVAAQLGSADFTVTDWAYESTAGDPIVTPSPEPSSMALLALGAAGVAARKRRNRTT